MHWFQNLSDLFTKAGLTRWPLFVCSVIGTAIIMERLYYFSRLHINYAGFSQKLFNLLRSGKQEEAVGYCHKFRNPVARIAGIYLQHLRHKLRDSVLSREGSMAIEKVERRLRGLATITHIAPLLGLLGTVAGLVMAFHQIELSAGQVQVQSLAGGIWEALLSTVFGLIVAIPCMVAYHGFESRADRIARRMQGIVSELDEYFGQPTAHDFKAANPEAENEKINVTQ